MSNAVALREKLQQHFSKIPANEQSSAWEQMWQQKVTPWDRSKPNPALIEALKKEKKLLGPSVVDGKRKKALIPGCGGGYDILLLASYGYDALGVDAALSAIEACRSLHNAENNAEVKQYPVKSEDIGAGSADFQQADFFKHEFAGQFDLIYDYTFLCALPPEIRPSWAKRMSSLLAPDGVLICIEFPLKKPLSAGGPPHGVSAALYYELFKTPGVDPIRDENGEILSIGRPYATDGLKREARWIPEESHHAGQGMDAVSFWRHCNQ
ncbi:hypothetical protein MRB53_039843 [Persea americana]|nr:hypothetical protein MRB53_039843 [Persea americana]